MFSEEYVANLGISSLIKSEYLCKDKWEEQRLEEELTADNSDFLKCDDILWSKSKKNSERITLEPIAKGIGIRNFRIQTIADKISDMELLIRVDDFNQDIIRELVYLHVTIKIADSLMCRYPLGPSLILSKLKGRKVIEENGILRIPLIFSDLISGDKFPIFLICFHELNISLLFLEERKMDIRLSFVCKNLEKQKRNALIKESNKTTELAILQIAINWFFMQGNKLAEPGLNFLTKLLFFEFMPPQRSNDMQLPIITEIRLYLCGYPIVYRDDKILRIKLFDRIYYGISFSPEYKTKADLKRIFNKKTKIGDKIGNKNFGINFSKYERVRIEFETLCEKELDNFAVGLIQIRYNVLLLSEGMAALKDVSDQYT